MEPQRPSAHDEIIALSAQKWRWSTDGRFDELADLFDDNLVFVHLTGHISTKDEWIGLLRSGAFVYDHIDVTEASARAHGDDLTVLVGKATFVVNGGAVYPLVYTEVYARTGSAWKLVNLHTCQGS
jgi:hypothetical protein